MTCINNVLWFLARLFASQIEMLTLIFNYWKSYAISQKRATNLRLSIQKSQSFLANIIDEDSTDSEYESSDSNEMDGDTLKQMDLMIQQVDQSMSKKRMDKIQRFNINSTILDETAITDK